MKPLLKSLNFFMRSGPERGGLLRLGQRMFFLYEASSKILVEIEALRDDIATGHVLLLACSYQKNT